MKNTVHLGSRRFAHPDQILNLEARDNYTFIRFADGSDLLSSTTLGVIEKRLSEFNFFRVNRATLVNLDYLNFFTIYYGSRSLHHSKRNTSIQVSLSRRRLAAFEACMES